MKRKTYIVLHWNSAKKLENDVNRFIEIGYLPIGGASVVYDNDFSTFWYTQAMMLPADTKR